MRFSLLLSLALGTALLLMLVGCRGDIKGSEAKELVKKGALLLDVRTEAEYKAKHISQARNIPVADLAKRLGELPKKERTIIVYCRSGARSARAQKLLKSKGYKTVYNLGGMGNWN